MARKTAPPLQLAGFADLLRALERARSRFAVAVASESKTTPLSRRIRYMEMEGRLRLCLSQLRGLPNDLRAVRSASWQYTLARLTAQLSNSEPAAETGAEILCGIIGDVLADLEPGCGGWPAQPLALGPAQRPGPASGTERDPSHPGRDSMPCNTPRGNL